MGSGAFQSIRRAIQASGGAIVTLGLGASLSGCPPAAKLENRDRFDVFDQGPVDCNQELPDGLGVIGCNYDALLKTHCASGGCHNRSAHTADLDLTPDPLLIARILEVPAQHRISCGIERCDLEMPQCEDCSNCPDDARLLTKTDFESSWIIEKMAAFDVDMPLVRKPMMCGYAMPLAPGNAGFTAETRTCLTNFFRYVADNGTKCTIPSGGSGGVGTGGSGGAGNGGAGNGGTGGT